MWDSVRAISCLSSLSAFFHQLYHNYQTYQSRKAETDITKPLALCRGMGTITHEMGITARKSTSGVLGVWFEINDLSDSATNA